MTRSDSATRVRSKRLAIGAFASSPIRSVSPIHRTCVLPCVPSLTGLLCLHHTDHPDYPKAHRKCTLVPYAISAKPGTVPFAVSGFNAPWASDQKWASGLGGIVAEGLDNAHAKKSDTVQMQAVTFDEKRARFEPNDYV